MKTFNLITTAVILSLSLSAFAGKEDRKWSDDASPAKLGSYNYYFKTLPLAGSIDLTKRGWSDTYWPLEQGMIAVRWQTPGGDFKKEKSPSRDQVSNLTQEQISLLSPAEKLDLAKNDYSYTVTESIRKDLSGNEKDWRGLCNGWTHAALNFDEPQPVVFTNSRGLKIPFGASDIKGLLAYYYAKVDDSSAILVGSRCRLRPAMAWASKACQDDVNAAAFHIILTNEIGIKKQGIAVDRSRYNEVWNQPYVKYEAHVISELDKLKGDKLAKNASKNAVKEITISADVYYAEDEEVGQSNLPFIGTDKNKLTKIVYNYLIELDVAGRVIGGEWLDGNYPDFIWRQHFNAPTGNLKIIQDIYEASQKTRS